jgi:hypothetical protein
MLVLNFHGRKDRVSAQSGRGTSVVPPAEATLTMSVVSRVTMIIGQPTDNRARELLMPRLVNVERLSQLLKHSLQILAIHHGVHLRNA